MAQDLSLITLIPSPKSQFACIAAHKYLVSSICFLCNVCCKRIFLYYILPHILAGFLTLVVLQSLEGRMLPSYTKRIADYAVVPITGWPVEKTVQHIVTDFWIVSLKIFLHLP